MKLGPPPTLRREACRWALRALVATQLAGPISYYAGLRAPDDERFAWRMFSAVRVRECRVWLLNHGPREPVRGLHSSWLHALERGREAVIARYLASRCGPEGAPALARSCHAASGEPLFEVVYRFDCASSALHSEGGGHAP